MKLILQLSLTTFVVMNLSEVFCQQSTSISSNITSTAKRLIEAKQLDSAKVLLEQAIVTLKFNSDWELLFESEVLLLQISRKQDKLDEVIQAFPPLISRIQEQLGQGTIIEAEALNDYGEAFYGKGLLDKAASLWQESISIYYQHAEQEYSKPIAYLANNMGIAYAILGYYDRSAKFFNVALNIYLHDKEKNMQGLAKTYNNLGNLYYLLGNYDKSISMYEESIRQKEIVYGDAKHPSIAVSSANLGNLLRAHGRHNESIEYLNKAIAIYDEEQEDQSEYPETAYGVLAQVYLDLEDYDQAKYYYEKEYEYVLESYGAKSIEMSESYLSQVIYYHKIGEQEQSLTYTRKLIDLLEKDLNLSNEDLAAAYYYQAKNLINLREIDKGITGIEQAIDIFDRLDITQHNILTDILTNSGGLLSNHGQHEYAKRYLESSLKSNLRTPWNGDYRRLNTEHVVNGTQFLTSLKYLIKLLKEQGAERNDDTLLKEAMHYVYLGDTLINSLQKHNMLDGDKLNFRERIDEIYKYGLFISHNLNENSRDKKWTEIAHYLMERNRNSLYLLETADANAKKLGTIPDSLISRENELNSLISYHKSRTYELENSKSIDTVRLEYHRNELFIINDQYRKWLKYLTENYPAYTDLKFKVNYPKIDDVQKSLEEDQTVVQYSIGNEKSFVLVINSDDYELKELSIDSSFNTLFKSFRTEITNPFNSDLTTFYNLSFEMYQVLVQPIESYLRHDLIFITGDKLSLIPFETLTRKNGARRVKSFRDLDYLIKSHNILYNNSASALLASNESNGDAEVSVLGLAPSFEVPNVIFNEDTTKEVISPLVWAEAEVEIIPKFFNTRLLKNKEANELNFKQLAPQKSIIHVASHVILDYNTPHFSRILLSNDTTEGDEDGLLYLHEIYNMHLDTELVILSACNTGAGAVVEGEGVVNLGNGFLGAGAESVVMSLWLVNDRTTATLMQNFYEQLDQKKSKDEALREAKLNYLDNASQIKAHPYFWSAFIINGDTRPIQSTNYLSKTNLILTILTFVLVGLGFIVFHKKRSKIF